MSTRDQIQQLARPLVDRYEDLALVGREIVLLPVHHYSRSVYIDRTSTKGMISPSWRVTLLFSPPPRATGWGNRLHVYGSVDDPHVKEEFDRVVNECLEEVLRPVTDLESLRGLPVLNGGREEMWPLQECLLVTARGDFRQAADGLSQLVDEDEQRLCEERKMVDLLYRPYGRPWVRQMEHHAIEQDRLTHLRHLLVAVKAGSRPPIADLLRGWERQNARTERVHDLWQPVPFPFELSGPFE